VELDDPEVACVPNRYIAGVTRESENEGVKCLQQFTQRQVIPTLYFDEARNLGDHFLVTYLPFKYFIVRGSDGIYYDVEVTSMQLQNSDKQIQFSYRPLVHYRSAPSILLDPVATYWKMIAEYKQANTFEQLFRVLEKYYIFSDDFKKLIIDGTQEQKDDLYKSLHDGEVKDIQIVPTEYSTINMVLLKIDINNGEGDAEVTAFRDGDRWVFAME
jgi:hypothetical protein